MDDRLCCASDGKPFQMVCMAIRWSECSSHAEARTHPRCMVHLSFKEHMPPQQITRAHHIEMSNKTSSNATGLDLAKGEVLEYR